MSDEHDAQQDRQMSAILASIASLTEQVAEITVAQHRAVRDLATRDEEIRAIRDTVQKNAETAREVLDLFSTLKGGFRVIGWLGTAAKGLAGLAAAAAALWAAYTQFRHGGPK